MQLGIVGQIQRAYPVIIAIQIYQLGVMSYVQLGYAVIAANKLS